MRRSDEAAFGGFVVAMSPALLRFARLLVDNDTDATDLLQTALVRLAGKWSTEIVDPTAYVKRTLVNLANSSWRSRRRRERLEGVAEPTTVRDHAETVVDADELIRALSCLPRRQRLVVVLRYVEGMSERDTAKYAGCSIGTVKSQASRGLAALRELLTEPAIASSRKANP